jgi:hypothetical protein
MPPSEAPHISRVFMLSIVYDYRRHEISTGIHANSCHQPTSFCRYKWGNLPSSSDALHLEVYSEVLVIHFHLNCMCHIENVFFRMLLCAKTRRSDKDVPVILHMDCSLWCLRSGSNVELLARLRVRLHQIEARKLFLSANDTPCALVPIGLAHKMSPHYQHRFH